MDHFVRIIFEKKEGLLESLDETIFPGLELLETEQDAGVFHIPLERDLTEAESDEYAEKLADYMFENGYDDFDIEISTTQGRVTDEETFEGNDFFEEYGVMWHNSSVLEESEYQGKKVKLGKPIRSTDGPKKFHVYVTDPTTKNTKKVNFGDPDMEIKADSPEAKKSFRARHNCDNPGPKTSAKFWSCKNW